MEWEDVKARLTEAMRDFLREDHELLSVNASERSMTHKLAEHLQEKFGDKWHVDCEYNRRESEIKRRCPWQSRKD